MVLAAMDCLNERRNPVLAVALIGSIDRGEEDSVGEVVLVPVILVADEGDGHDLPDIVASDG